MLSSQARAQENPLLTKETSDLFLESFERMISEIALLHRKKRIVLNIDALLEILTLYISFQLVTFFDAEEEIVDLVIDQLKNQAKLAKQLSDIFEHKDKEGIKKLRNLTQHEGFGILQTAKLFYFLEEQIQDNKSYLSPNRSEFPTGFDAAKTDIGLIMERYLESAWQAVQCLYKNNMEEGIELLLYLVCKVTLLSAQILAVRNDTLDDYISKAEVFFQDTPAWVNSIEYETIH